MGIFNIYKKAKKRINKSNFNQKNSISFKAYEILKKYVVQGVVNPDKLDMAYPKNNNLKVLKNVSPRSMKTFYKLSDRCERDKNGVLSQINSPNINFKRKLSAKARKLLQEIKTDKPRYESIDLLLRKISEK